MRFAPVSKGIWRTGPFTVVLSGGDAYYVCGVNTYGQLGIGNYETIDTFTRMDLPVRFSSISIGRRFCVGIAEEDGSLWSWGSNSTGQLGIPPVGTNDKILRPQQIPNTQYFIQVSSGKRKRSVIIKSDH
jgi:alpha-tubulin suppressor-like RCC1 family protein